jgi:hypothetical protein
MGTIISLLAIFGLAFLIKESDGPWGIMAWIRNQLIRNKYVGVFFYKLLSCYFCVGFHCGWIVYLLQEKEFAWQFLILWGLTGGVICLILDGVLTKLHTNDSQ